MKPRSCLLQGFVLGIICGVVTTRIYLEERYTTFNKPEYSVGDCLSNGLYFESITEIRKSKFGMDPMYVTDTYFPNNKRGKPETTETWIADKDYVNVDPKNCTVRK